MVFSKEDAILINKFVPFNRLWFPQTYIVYEFVLVVCDGCCVSIWYGGSTGELGQLSLACHQLQAML